MEKVLISQNWKRIYKNRNPPIEIAEITQENREFTGAEITPSRFWNVADLFEADFALYRSGKAVRSIEFTIKS
jgi:hypothetical protein